MGYRSDIAIAFAFKTKEQIEELMAIYRMNEKVQKYECEKHWNIHDWGESWGLTLTINNVKWYDAYEDVQAFEYMHDLVLEFYANREGFRYAYRMILIGEEDKDIVVVNSYSPDDYELHDQLLDRMNLSRLIETNF